MTTLCLHADALIASDGAHETVQPLPRYEIDPEERRWQLEWDRRNVED